MGQPLEDGGLGDDDGSIDVDCCDLIQRALRVASSIERLDTVWGFQRGRDARWKHGTVAALTFFTCRVALD